MITYDEVIADLEAIVAEKGADFVYSNGRGYCTYRNEDGSPSCIAGHVFHRHDLLTDDMGESGFLHDDGGWTGPDLAMQNFSEDALAALGEAQWVQDTPGNTWGQALEAAKAVRG